jgi:polyhydroxyalkanoate synthase subunit PhaC
VDLIPKPDQVVSAAANVALRVANGGLADVRPMPRTLIGEGTQREVYHYDPEDSAPERGEPILLVTPLAAPSICYDLRRGCSLVEHLVGDGRRTYLVEYGAVMFRDRHLGMEQWIDEVVPTAIREVSRHSGGRPVHVIGWSLGGIFALLAAADDASLPIASLAALGAPFDVREVPMVAPPRPLLSLTDGPGAAARLYQAAGGARQPLVRWAVQQSAFQRLVTKPLAVVSNLDDADYLAQIEAVDRFTAHMAAYPGRTFGQLYHRLLTGNSLVDGTFDVEGRTISVGAVTAPVLVVGGASDGIAPLAAVRAAVPLLRGSLEARFELVPGGHLGMLTGRGARDSTWRVLDEWVDQWSGADEPNARAAPPRRTARKSGAKKATPKAAAKKVPAKRVPAKRVPAKKAAAKKAGAGVTADAIGTDPTRRYGSASSRGLGGAGSQRSGTQRSGNRRSGTKA